MLELLNKDIFGEIATSDALCITTNCTISDDGANPMGAMAGAAARRWPLLPTVYGAYLTFMPLVPVVLGYVDKKNPVDKKADLRFDSAFRSSITAAAYRDKQFKQFNSDNYCAIVAYPTMVEFGAPASLDLVVRSANLLVEMADRFGWKRIVQGRPGCGVGGLDWEKQVKPRLEVLFDDRFVMMHK